MEEFIERSETEDNFCLFISPLIHDRAAKAYFQANKNGFGSDKKLGIIPLKHDQFCKILNVQSELFKVNQKIDSSRNLKNNEFSFIQIVTIHHLYLHTLVVH